MTNSKRHPVEYRPITFTCEWCYKESTELHYPGAKPRYHQECKAEAQKEGAKVRMQRMRERQALENPPQRGPGRPRKS